MPESFAALVAAQGAQLQRAHTGRVQKRGERLTRKRDSTCTGHLTRVVDGSSLAEQSDEDRGGIRLGDEHLEIEVRKRRAGDLSGVVDSVGDRTRGGKAEALLADARCVEERRGHFPEDLVFSHHLARIVDPEPDRPREEPLTRAACLSGW